MWKNMRTHENMWQSENIHIHIFEHFSLDTHFRVFKPSHEKHLEHLSFYTHFRAFKPSYTFWASHKSFHVEQSETLTEWKFESVADRRPADGHLTWVGAGDTWMSKKVCQVHILKFWWAYIFCVPSTYGFFYLVPPPPQSSKFKVYLGRSTST